jgi:hypothetical protein
MKVLIMQFSPVTALQAKCLTESNFLGNFHPTCNPSCERCGQKADKVVVLYHLFNLYNFRCKGEGKANDTRHS